MFTLNSQKFINIICTDFDLSLVLIVKAEIRKEEH